MRLHLPALPGQDVTAENSTCAFTQKVRRFADMMTQRGHEVRVYGSEDFDHAATHIACYPNAEPPEFTQAAWAPFNEMAREAIEKELEPDDLICLIGGSSQLALTDLPAATCEFGIGYGGSIVGHPRVFESYAWMHATYAADAGSNNEANGNFYDAVIPASFDPSEFDFQSDKEDYLLFVGRLIERKGLDVACQAAERLGCDLLIAGEGDYEPTYGQMLGRVGPQERAELMAKARALIAPTLYLEPFGFVVVEAMLSGTPVITTDWGAFTETVEHGTTGYRCRMLQDFCDAVEACDSLDPEAIRAIAEQKYSYEAIGPRYDQYFQMLATLKGAGWYSTEGAPKLIS
jgi:hypothetical protein